MIFLANFIATFVATSLLVAHLGHPGGVDAHGYLKSPRSRNYRASIDPKYFGGTATDPGPENCPHCLNIGGTEARCGKVGDHNYDYPPNAIGGVLPPLVQECYEEGAIIDIESVLTAHHMGHFEVKSCLISPGEVATQECFDANPLVFVSDELYGAPPHSLHPGRAYIPRTDYPGGLARSTSGDYLFHHKFRLPAGIRGDLVLLQWYYVTANSCTSEGYDTYAWPTGFRPGNVPVCEVIPPDGRGVPEQFWNCAEVSIKVDNGCGTPPSPTAAVPTSIPTHLPTAFQQTTTSTVTSTTGATAVTTTTTSSTRSSSTIPSSKCASETATCGLNKPCTGGMCCSQWGYCGTSEAYCGACCQNGNCLDLPKTNAPSGKPVQPATNLPTTAVPSRKPVQSETGLPTTATSSCQTCPSGATGLYAMNNCTGFRQCISGESTATFACGAGTLFDEKLGVCNWSADVNCHCSKAIGEVNPTASPTQTPSSKPTHQPTSGLTTIESPTTKPTTAKPTTISPTTATVGTAKPTTLKPPTTKPSTVSPTTSKPVLLLFPSSSPMASPSSIAAAVEAVLEAHKDGIDNNILLYQTPQSQWIPSSVYRYKDLLDGLRVMYNDGVANKYFYMGDDSSKGHLHGLVNIAAFLAQSMKETIQYNACDENSWDLVNGKYALSNSCGQLGQSYQDYKCSESEAHMECPVNPNMEIRATTNAKWYGAPGPLFCGPKAKYPFTGFWDYSKECNMLWANPPEYCDVYEGQKAGGFDNSMAVPNSMGRTDVEGCCFWGRGVIQTTGVCNFGKLNYYLGKRAKDEGRESRYPDINFCEQPNAICDSEEHRELKWIAGMFYWVESLQSYDVGGWDYLTELKKFVDGGLKGNGFIDAVSGIVNRGCHNPPCAAGPVDGLSDRSSNFFKILKELDLVNLF